MLIAVFSRLVPFNTESVAVVPETASVIAGAVNLRLTSPLGPLTVMVWPLKTAVTPVGISMLVDMSSFMLVTVGDESPSVVVFFGFFVSHEAFRRADDDDADVLCRQVSFFELFKVGCFDCVSGFDDSALVDFAEQVDFYCAASCIGKQFCLSEVAERVQELEYFLDGLINRHNHAVFATDFFIVLYL